MKKTVLITGTSSGFGFETAWHFHRKGWNVIATMRVPKQCFPLDVLVTKLDVRDEGSIKDSIKKGKERFGNIDVFINNAGYCLAGSFDNLSMKQIESQFQVNTLGTSLVSKYAYDYFLEQGFGTIITVSSIAGRLSLPFMSAYNASKFAIEGFFESLYYEAKEKNIIIKLLELGYFSTNFVKNTKVRTKKDKYLFMSLRLKNNLPPGNPIVVAKKLYSLALDNTDNLRYRVGIDAKGAYMFNSLLGNDIFRKLLALRNYPRRNLKEEFSQAKHLIELDGVFRGVFLHRWSVIQYILKLMRWQGKEFFHATKSANALVFQKGVCGLGKATLNSAVYKNKNTVVMKYSYLPITDYFRLTNDKEIIGEMTFFKIPVYYFILRKVSNSRV